MRKNRVTLFQYAEKIKDMYLLGESMTYLAKKFDVNVYSIQRLLLGQTYGGRFKVKEPGLNKLEGVKVDLHFDNGRVVRFKTIRELSKIFGVNESFISNVLAKKPGYNLPNNLKVVRVDEQIQEQGKQKVSQ